MPARRQGTGYPRPPALPGATAWTPPGDRPVKRSELKLDEEGGRRCRAILRRSSLWCWQRA